MIAFTVYCLQVQCNFCGQDSQGAESAETSQSHQPSQRTEGTRHASTVLLKKIMYTGNQ